MDMIIRQATIEDLAEVRNLFTQYRQFYKQPADIEGEHAFIQGRLEQGDSIIYVAIVDEEFAGFTQLYPAYSSVAMKRTYILNDLYVQKKFRQLGVAQKLMEESYALCEQEDARYITLQTAHDNYTAQKLYEKMGMIIDETFLRYTKFW